MSLLRAITGCVAFVWTIIGIAVLAVTWPPTVLVTLPTFLGVIIWLADRDAKRTIRR